MKRFAVSLIHHCKITPRRASSGFAFICLCDPERALSVALLWCKQVAGKRYEVRQAGSSLRLYTDGTFHSQYNARRPFSGSIWDLLLLPALFTEARPRRVLVLGVGGGAVICLLRQLIGPSHITGIELDPVHIHIARQHFGLRSTARLKLIHADAIQWLKSYRGPAFDLIIDDLFVENGGSPFRAIQVDAEWGGQLVERLSPCGALVVNFESRQAMRASALFKELKIPQPFSSRWSLSVPGYDNRIAACFRGPAQRSVLKDNLQQLEQRFGRGLTRPLKAGIRLEA